MRSLVRVVARRRWAFALGASVVFCAALVAVPRLLPVRYTGTVSFDEFRAPAGAGRPAEDGSASPWQGRPGFLSKADVARAARRVGLVSGLGESGSAVVDAAQDHLLARLMADLDVTRETRPQGPTVVTVRFTHRDRLLAQELTNALAQSYLADAREAWVAHLAQRSAALGKQVEECNGRLEDLTRRQIAFETERAATLPESPGAAGRRVQDIRAEIEAHRSREAAARQKLARLKPLAAQPAASGQPDQVVKGPNPALKHLEDQLRQAEAELEEATTVRSMTDTHPTVQRIRMKIDALRRQIEQTPQEAVLQTVYDRAGPGTDVAVQIAAAQAEADVAALEIERLQRQLADAQKALAEFGPARQEYLAILKQVEEQQAELKRSREAFAEAEGALESAQAAVAAQPAGIVAGETPRLPSSPRLWEVLAWAAAGSLAVGVGLALAAERADQTVATAEQAARRFGAPVLGTIREIRTPARRVLRALGRWALRPLVLVIVALAVAAAVVNVVLWLRFPEEYERWTEDPAAFVSRQLGRWSGGPGRPS